MSRPTHLAVIEAVASVKMLPHFVALILVPCGGSNSEAASVRTFVPKTETKVALLEPWNQSLMARMATRKAFLNGGFATHPDLAGLEPKLREAALGLVPDAKVQTTPLTLSVSYRWDTVGTDWPGHRAAGLRRGLHTLAANFSEFRLEVTLKSDGELERPFHAPQLQTDPFGMTWKARYSLRRLESRGTELDEVALDDSVYVAYDRLANEGLVENRLPRGTSWGHPRALTRYEFAGAVTSLLSSARENTPPFLNRKATLAVDYLQGRFAAEIHDLQKPAPIYPKSPVDGIREEIPHQFLSVSFSYGRGVSPKAAYRKRHHPQTTCSGNATNEALPVSFAEVFVWKGCSD